MIKVAGDVETTGFKPFWHDVISIGLAAYEPGVDAPLATFYGTCRPWTPSTFDPESTNAHGFTLDDVMRFQDPRSLCIQILHFLKEFYRPGSYLPFIYHAQANFDLLHIIALFVKCELQFSLYKVFSETCTRSTLLEARSLGYKGNDLKSWASRLNREFVHHNALDDALMCGAVDNYLIKHGGPNALESITQQKPELHQAGILTLSDLPANPRKGRQLRRV